MSRTSKAARLAAVTIRWASDAMRLAEKTVGPLRCKIRARSPGMNLREGTSDTLLDEIMGSDRIARQTSRIPPKLGEVGFDASVQNGGRNRGPLLKAGAVTGDRCYRRLPARHIFITPHCEPLENASSLIREA
jgi:hypothetical protein